MKNLIYPSKKINKFNFESFVILTKVTKFYFLFPLLLFFSLQRLSAQLECESLPFDQNTLHDVGLITNSSGPVTVKLYFLVYSDNQGTGGISPSTLEATFDLLNDRFSATPISFYYNAGETKYIKNNALFNSTNPQDFFNPSRHTDGIDVHITGDNSPYIGMTSNIPGDEIVIGGKGLLDGNLPARASSILAHQFGHCFGLFHTHRGCFMSQQDAENGDFVGDTPKDPNIFAHVNALCVWDGQGYCSVTGWNPALDNMMSYSNDKCRNHFTEGQVSRMMMYMLPEVIYSGNNQAHCPVDAENLVINNTTTITDDKSYNSITIKSGSELIIQSKVTMRNKIVVEQGAKLTLDGGTLTNCPEVKYWKGIQVIGNPFMGQGFPSSNSTYASGNGGVVSLQNNAVLENAETGINTSNEAFGGIFGYLNLSGGLIIAENATIRNCKIGVNFGPYGFGGGVYMLEDASYFKNVHFEEYEYAIKLFSNYGIEFTSCHFEASSNGAIGIQGTSSKIKVEQCDFEGGDTGIFMDSPWPTIGGSEITQNNFLDNREGIYWSSLGNFEPVNITYNNITSGTGLIASGLSFFNVQGNEFIGNHEGVIVSSTAEEDFNFVQNNRFSSVDYATTVYGKNNHEYNDNCFENIDIFNIELYKNSSIYFEQGNSDVSAGNCFDKNVAQIITGYGTESFNYHTLEKEFDNSCKVPSTAGNWNLLKDSKFENSTNCGTSLWGTLPSKYRNCIIPTSLVEKKSMEKALKAEIDRIKKDPNISDAMKKWLIRKYQRCLKLLVSNIVSEILTEEGREKAIEYLSQQELFSNRILAYGLIIEKGDLNDAETYLNSLNYSNEIESAFIESQRIYLKFIFSGDKTSINNSELLKLEEWASEANEFSGFYKAMLKKIDYGYIDVINPHLITLNPRNASDSNKIIEDVTIYPNPIIDDNFFIILDKPNLGETYKILDVYGKCLQTGDITSGVNEIKLNKDLKGLYLIHIYDGGLKISETKLLKM